VECLDDVNDDLFLDELRLPKDPAVEFVDFKLSLYDVGLIESFDGVY